MQDKGKIEESGGRLNRRKLCGNVQTPGLDNGFTVVHYSITLYSICMYVHILYSFVPNIRSKYKKIEKKIIQG